LENQCVTIPSALPCHVHWYQFHAVLLLQYAMRIERDVTVLATWALVLLTSTALSHTPFRSCTLQNDIRGNVVGWGTIPQDGRLRIRFPMSLDFSIDLILPPSLWLRCRLSL
jgi:hypothetical protein